MVWTIIILVGLLLDQVSKLVAQNHLASGGVVSVIGEFFVLEYHVNTGAAWSFLANQSWGIYVLSAISVGACVLFIYWLIKIKDHRVRFCLSLIIAGTAGNMVDRIFRGGVIDFLSFRFGQYQFPVFNVADSILVVGVTLLLLSLLFTDSKRLLQEDRPDEDANRTGSPTKGRSKGSGREEGTHGMD